jgi:ribosomal protein S1
VEDGLEGLIHVSELQQDVSAAALLHPRDVVQPGDTVRTRVLNVDGENRRIGLSMRLDVGSPRVSTVGMEVEVS